MSCFSSFRLTYTPDAKIPNSGTFKIEREDHTLANLLRMELLKNDRVLFVGYKIPHPLDHHFLLRVQTVGPEYTPRDALQAGVAALLEGVEALRRCVESFERSGRR